MTQFLIIYSAIITTINLIALAIISRDVRHPIYLSNVKPEDIDMAEMQKGGVIFPKKKEKRTGAIYLPEDEVEAARQDIIKKNQSEGKDTPIEDLMDVKDE